MVSNEVSNDETFKEFQNVPKIPAIPVVKEIDIKKSIEQLYMSAVSFALSLHNNNYPVSDENCHMTNFIQGSLWKEKIALYHNKIVVPFFMYIDDFEINRSL